MSTNEAEIAVARRSYYQCKAALLKIRYYYDFHNMTKLQIHQESNVLELIMLKLHYLRNYHGRDGDKQHYNALLTLKCPILKIDDITYKGKEYYSMIKYLEDQILDLQEDIDRYKKTIGFIRKNNQYSVNNVINFLRQTSLGEIANDIRNDKFLDIPYVEDDFALQRTVNYINTMLLGLENLGTSRDWRVDGIEEYSINILRDLLDYINTLNARNPISRTLPLDTDNITTAESEGSVSEIESSTGSSSSWIDDIPRH